MKKLIAILAIAIVLVGAVFATDPEVNLGSYKITLTSDVAPYAPQFLFEGSLTGTTYTAQGTAGEVAAANKLVSQDSIADTDITAYFIIKQNGAKDASGAGQEYARWNTPVYFTIAVTNLTEVNPADANDVKSAPGAVDAASLSAAAAITYSGKKNGATTNLTNALTNAVLEDGRVGFSATYNGKVVDQTIGTFSVTWKQDDSLPNGAYSADIILTISAS